MPSSGEIARISVTDARRIADEALNDLATELDKGQSQRLRAYLERMGRFHRYSVGNLLLILWQRPDATRVAGFRTWKQLGRSVRRGEHGIRILAPIIARAQHDDVRHDDDDQQEVVSFRNVTVFDLAQTDGKPLGELGRVHGDPRGHLRALMEFASKKRIDVSYSSELGSAQGLSAGGRIVLREGLCAAAETSVLIHELAHEMLHRDERRGERSKVVVETEAEAVAFVVCTAVGLESKAASGDYIQLYQGKKETLLASLGRIQQAASEIIEAVVEEPRLANNKAPAGANERRGETVHLATPAGAAA
jgi:antirestriction protein ArdC